MTNVQQKLKRPRLGNILLFNYQELNEISTAPIGVFEADVKPKSLSVKKYFSIMMYQDESKHKMKDSQKSLEKSIGKEAKTIHVMKMWVQIHALIKEIGIKNISNSKDVLINTETKEYFDSINFNLI